MENLLANLNFTTLQNIEEKYLTYDICMNLVKKNGFEIEHVPNKFYDRKMCMEAVKNDGLSISHVSHIDREICMVAIENNFRSLSLIPMKHRTKELCQFAFEINTDSILYFPEELRTNEYIEEAFNNNNDLYYLLPEEKRTRKIKRNSLYYNGMIIKHMKNSPNGLYRIALNTTPESIQYVPRGYLDQETCIKVVQRNGLLIKHIPSDLLTDKIVCAAINQNPESILNIPLCFQKSKMINLAIKRDGMMIKHFTNKNIPDNMYIKAVESNPFALEFIPNYLKTEILCKNAFEQEPLVLEFIPKDMLSIEDILIQFDKNPEIIRFIEQSQITKDMCLRACEEYIMYIPEALLDHEIVRKSIDFSIENIVDIPSELISDELYIEILKNDASWLPFIEDRDRTTNIMNILLDQFENNEATRRLKLISELKPGDTISSNYSMIMNHKSWYSSFWRTYSGDTRMNTIEWIKNTFDMASKTFLDKNLFKNALIGVNNLCITYENDESIKQEIEELIKKYTEY